MMYFSAQVSEYFTQVISCGAYDEQWSFAASLWIKKNVSENLLRTRRLWILFLQLSSVTLSQMCCEWVFFVVVVFMESRDFLSVNVMKQDKAVLWFQLSTDCPQIQGSVCQWAITERTAPLWTAEGGVLLLMSCNSCSSLAQSPQCKVIRNFCDGLQKQSPAWHATLWTGEESESQGRSLLRSPATGTVKLKSESWQDINPGA